jgi:hypothetical protein
MRDKGIKSGRPEVADTESTNVSTKSASASADADEPWVKKLSPADQVAYRKARLSWGQAKAAYAAAERAAKVGEDKPQKDFDDAAKAYDDRVAEREELKKQAAGKKAAIDSALKEVDPTQSENAALAARQGAALQAAVDAYTAAVQAVAKKGDEIAAAQAALAKLSDPQEAFNRKTIHVNSDSVDQARNQYQLDVATAQITYNAAEDVYQEATATLKSHLE